MSGRLQRQARSQSSFGPCPCGHGVEQHREKGTPGVFPCEVCNCENYRKQVSR